jgi:hypothetical protein
MKRPAFKPEQPLKRHLSRAAVAAFVTAGVVLPGFLWSLLFRVGGIWSPWSWPHSLQLAMNYLAETLSWAAFPAIFILAAFGDRAGPEGMPGFRETVLVTFVFWWIALDFGPPLWKWFWREPANPPST